MSAYITYTVKSGDSLGAIAAEYGTTWQVLAAINHLANPNLIYPGQMLSIPVSDDHVVGDQDILNSVIEFGRAELGKPYCGPMVRQPDHMRYGNPGWDCSSFVSGMYSRATGGVTRLTAYTDAAYDQCEPVSEPHAGDIVFYRYDDHDPETTSRFPHMGIWINDQQTLDCRHPNGVAFNPHLNCPREVRTPRGLPRSVATSAPVTTAPATTTSATSTYVVVAGDNLSSIAAAHGTTVADILRINPEITDPNLILVGQRIRIPGASAPASAPPTATSRAPLPADLSAPYGQWVPYVNAAGADYDLEPALVMAIIQVESDGRNIVGDGGHGRGLMQIDDRSHQTWLATHDWRDPAENIDYGCSVLKSCLNIFGGNLQNGVSAYNAGPGNVRRALDEGASPDKYTTHRNGKGYSELVFENRDAFRQRIAPSGWADLEASNPNIQAQLAQWRDARHSLGQDSGTWPEFRAHLVAIHAPDPGPGAPAGFSA